MAISLCCAPKENHPGNLEIEHVSPIVAFVCNHMLLWLWLSQKHWEDPCIVFRLTENEGTRNPTWVPEDKLAMVYGRTLWKDFVTLSICQYSILCVLIQQPQSSGHWWQQDGIVTCG